MIDENALYQQLQRDFPLNARPYRQMAGAIGLCEHDLLSLLARDIGSGRISRIGARFAPDAIGASTLAALAVPVARIDAVARRLNADPAVCHHYARSGHRYNLWFVAGARNPGALGDVMGKIAEDVRQIPLDLPLERDFHLNGGLPLRPVMTDRDWRLVAALEDGLPLTPEPYHAVARATGIAPHEIWRRLAYWRSAGVVVHLGAMLRARQFGYLHNAMCVWNVPDARVEAVGRRVARLPAVARCQLRRRRGQAWPFNLLAMIHARNPAEMQQAFEGLASVSGLAGVHGTVLRARCCFRQRGIRYGKGIED